jgi:lipid-A-disaccharide synthase
VAARWVGHPAGALAPDPARREEARRALEVDSGDTLIALLPGSRKGEVRHHLAPMLDAALRLVSHAPGRVRVAVSDAGPVEEERARGATRGLWDSLRPIQVRGESEPLLRAADLAVVASGTATLEAASIGVPLVIIYRTSALNFAIARRLVRLPRIGLANIVMGQDVAPERIQDAATGAAIAAAGARLLEDPAERERQRSIFSGLPERLGGAGAAERAADAILEFVQSGRAAQAPAARG